MGFAIGFGSTEQQYEENEERDIRDAIGLAFEASGVSYFSDPFVKSIKELMETRAKETQRESEKYKTAADFPDRYSYYWAHVVADGSHLVVILSIHHINRRHALSPDGWACMVSERVFVLKSYDLK